MSQDVMANLYDTTKQNISYHLNNIFKENELNKDSVVKDFLTTASDGKNYNVLHYNLDAIIAVGYRINSKKATEFRIWATKVLKEYMIKGFALNDERLKNNGESSYFEELLARIRDIRSSEKVFWRKVLDIYATSIDYNPKDKLSIDFFKTVQNKMHYATHAEEELNILNRMVSAYLDVAEIHALDRHPMTMQDWTDELDSFLKMTRKDILKGSGTISHEKALSIRKGT
mgnify:CR=1 FL=1